MIKKSPAHLRFLFIVLLSPALLMAGSAAQDDSSKKSAADSSEALLAGDWRGDSICQVRESACHDEDSLYHFTKVPGKPGAYSLQADKIVDGKPETMGVLDCSYDAKGKALECFI